MKLELKHLAPYLPYGLRCKEGNTTFEMTGAFLDEWYNWGELPKEMKPILRPLSDFYKIDNDFDLSTDFESCYTASNSDIALINTCDKTYTSDMLTVLSFLFENHFDVFGLIDKDLAIDINTL